MIWRLAAFELVLLRRDHRAGWSLLCLAALVLLAFAATAFEQTRANTSKANIAMAERARWLAQPAKDPHSAAHYSIYAFKPTPVLAALDPGVEPFVGQTLWLEAHQQNDALYRPLELASTLQRAGLANPAALLLGVAPLLAFLLTFSAAAMDRERGTLRLALGAAATPQRIIAGKALAIWSVLTLALILPATVGDAVVALISDAFTADGAIRLMLWSAAMALYFAVLVAVGLAVSLWLNNVRATLAVLFGVWMLVALALPRWANDWVEKTHPLPSSQAIRQQLQEEAPAYWMAEEAKARQADLLARHGVKRKEDLHVDFRGAELDMAERHSHAVFDRVLGGFYDRVIAQDRGFSSLGWLSPTAAMQSVSAALAGSDFAHHRRFIDAAEVYRRALVNRMNAEVMAHPSGADGSRHTADTKLWAQIPEFRYANPPLVATWQTATPAALALVIWLAVALLLLTITARRLRP